ncbi:MAG: hypothetical protein PHI35_06180 [Victivallaceae bacterium]|nr:hypothetical protein [Victivallaceae bacterium]
MSRQAWLRSAVATALLVGLWFGATSNWFVTGVILPAASSLTGVEIVARNFYWSPLFSRAAADDLRIGSEKNPYFKAGRAECGYGLFALLGGRVELDNVLVERGEFTLYSDRGRWSAVPIVWSEEKKSASAPSENRDSAPSSPLRLDLRHVNLVNSTFALVSGSGDAAGRAVFSNLRGKCERFANGERFTTELASDFTIDVGAAQLLTGSKARVGFDVVLGDDFIPRSGRISAGLNGITGRAGGRDLAGDQFILDGEFAEKSDVLEVKSLSLESRSGDTVGSRLELAGAVELKPFACRVDIREFKVSPEFAALWVGMFTGCDPGMVSAGGSGRVEFSRERFFCAGKLDVKHSGGVTLPGGRFELPDFDLKGECNFSVNLTTNQMDLRKLAVTVAGDGRRLLNLQLVDPVKGGWSDADAPEGKDFELDTDHLELRYFAPLLPPGYGVKLDGGVCSGKVRFSFFKRFSGVNILGALKLTEAAAVWRKNRTVIPEAELTLDGGFVPGRQVMVRSCSVLIRRGGRSVGALNLNGSWRIPDKSGEFSLRVADVGPGMLNFVLPKFSAVADGWRKFGGGNGWLEASGRVSEGGKNVRLGRLRFVLPDEGGDEMLSVSSNAIGYDFERGRFTETLKLTVEGSLIPARFNPLTRRGGLEFGSGHCRLKLDGVFDKELRELSLYGKLGGDKVDFALNGKRYHDFAFQNTLRAVVRGSGVVEFEEMDFYVKCGGKPAFRLEYPGVWNSQDGSYRGVWKLAYLNENTLNLFLDGRVQEARIDGKFNVDGKNNFRDIELNGSVTASGVKLSGAALDPFSGRFELNAARLNGVTRVKTLTAEVRQNSDPVFTALFKGGAGQYQLDIAELDIPPLLGAWGAEPAENDADRKSARESAPALVGCGNPWQLDLAVRHFKLNEGLTGSLFGRFKAGGGTLRSDDLKLGLNKSVYTGGVLLGNRPSGGVNWRWHMRGAAPLEIRPVVEFLLATDNETGLTGTVSAADVDLNGVLDMAPAVDSLGGRVSLDFADLNIPSGVTNGPFGKLLLLPVDGIAYLTEAMPQELSQWKSKLLDDKNVRRQLESVKFDRGEVKVEFNNGVAKIDSCRFFGPTVKRLIFGGSFSLKEPRDLNVSAKIAASGAEILIPITGTLDEPSLDVRHLLTGAAGNIFERLKQLKIIGVTPDSDSPDQVTPVIILDELPSAGALRELGKSFKDLIKGK